MSYLNLRGITGAGLAAERGGHEARGTPVAV